MWTACSGYTHSAYASGGHRSTARSVKVIPGQFSALSTPPSGKPISANPSRRVLPSVRENTASPHPVTKGARQIGGQRMARLRVAPQAGPPRARLAGQPQGAAQSLVVPQEIARAYESALLEQHLVLMYRAVLQSSHGRGQRVLGGRRTLGAQGQHVDHRWRQLAQLVADDADQLGRIGGRIGRRRWPAQPADLDVEAHPAAEGHAEVGRALARAVRLVFEREAALFEQAQGDSQ